jgi:hypothetical protein
LRPKINRLLFGQFVGRKIINFQFPLLDEWATYFTSFLWIPSIPNSDFVWARGEFLLKSSFKLILHVFLKSPICSLCGWNYPEAEGQGFKKIVYSAYKILVFYFISPFYFLDMVLHDVTFNVTAMSWLWSFDFFPLILMRSIVLKFGV